MKNPSDSKPVILCLAHLAWDFVWQRPQHLLSRLAAHYPVYYVNEPWIEPAAAPHLRLVGAADNLLAYQPIFPADRPDVIADWQNSYVDLVTRLLVDESVVFQNGHLKTARPLILWFYTPIPAYFADRLPADLIVYDIMDELANFKGAPPDMKERERHLLRRADVVFTGGRSMYEARRGAHPNLHLFPSGVDRTHFHLTDETPLAPEVAGLPRPVLGYYGVIDERLDLGLIDRLAVDHPEWSVVLVGPLAKITPEDLPRRPNIHYPGQQPYGRLPHFLKGFDVCLMPFAINDATRYISPTKTLEYMAAHKPIVSTPIHDVAATWADVVAVADTPEAFGAAVERALGETPAERAARRPREQAHLRQYGWDHIAGQMHNLLTAAWNARHPVAAGQPVYER